MQKRIIIDKDTLYDLYIVQQKTSKEIGLMYNCTSKCIRNHLYKSGIPVRQVAEAVKLERTKWTPEKEANRSKKFIETWHNKSDEERLEITAKKTRNANTPESIETAKQTKFKNGTYLKSKAEDNFYKQLLLYFPENDIIRGYIDKDRYPFNCDFYVKSKDLFIEYQGHQTHGYAPYDDTNSEHKEYLIKMQSHKIDTKTWTIRDTNKLKVATQNNIKLLLIYPKNNSYLLKDGNLNMLPRFSVVDINDIN